MILQLADARPDRTAWVGLALVLLLHLAAIALLLSYAPAREVLKAIAPVIVELIKPAVPVAPLPAPKVEPRVDVEVKPRPVTKPAAQPQPQPQPQITAVPTQSSPVMEVPAAPDPKPAAEVAVRPPSPPAPAPAPPAAPPVAAAPVAIVPPSFNADYLDNPAPVYPALAKRMGEEGRVFLRVQVEASGLPSKVEVRTSSGSERLDQAALEAVKRWKFVPAKQGDKPVPASVVVPITFNLKG